ncbi:DUF397 domain-containing protein [Streptomyces sp. NPDC058304]|uniref:DUF397 domain-containing protein n=1 Tax=Streptomyces sp. NPDC058304 TaxID=3346437 RepID=UPI0036EC9A6B
MSARPVRHSHPTHLARPKPAHTPETGDPALPGRPRPPRMHVRDSKVPHGPSLALTPTAWSQLTHWFSG